jgi:DNA-binding NtrC family response regulator
VSAAATRIDPPETPPTEQPCVLVVEDDAHSLELTASFVGEAGGEAVGAATLAEAFRQIDRLGERLAFIITDIKLGDGSGLELFGRMRETRPELPVVLITAFGSTDQAVSAMKQGAFYYFTKPVNFPLLLRLVREAIEKRALARQVRDLRARLAVSGHARILGLSPALAAALRLARNVAGLDTTVLLTGETGTGKELLAEYIHEHSPRRQHLLVAINCAALPEPLLESELFGHERGAFTGAIARKRGKFEQAHRGTVFLDEVGDLALPLQAKLLRALESKRIEPLGAHDSVEADVRIIAASNRELPALMRAGQFREDLYYRLGAFPIVLPPLRERKEDIPVLAAHFLEQFAQSHDKVLDGFDREALAALQAHAWPGNVRELRHVVERAAILASGQTITPDLLPMNRDEPASRPREVPVENLAQIRELEREAVRRAVEAAGGNRTRAAQALGMTRNQIRYRLRQKADA